MKKLVLATALCSVAVVGNVSGQKCGNDLILHEKLSTDPDFKSRYEQYVDDVMTRTQQYEQLMAGSAQKTTASVTIPVVFHVILTQAQIDQIGGLDGIFDRVVTQIDVLNRDFNARNADSTKITPAYKSRFGNPEISFGAAHRDPSGKTTSGVEIRVAPPGFKGFEPNQGFCKYTSNGGLDAWDHKKYLNIWIVNMIDAAGNQSNVLGFGYSPGYATALGAPNQAGVVLTYGAFGKKTSKSTYFNGPSTQGGRTLVHELGHFFNLWHIWGNSAVGSGDCSDDDGISDTPMQADANQSCPSTPKANCINSTGGEMYMNYMDYPGDNCIVMFTKGQVTRMKAQLMLDSASYGLTQHPELLTYPTGIQDVESIAGIDIYPNPATANINVHIENNASLKSISIINIMGQPIKQINADGNRNQYNFDLSNLPKGVYTVQCLFETGAVTKKLVLQ